MSRSITIAAGDVTVAAELDESPTAHAVWDALPIDAAANVWGDEIYFEIPVDLQQAPDAREEVEVGTLAYWPMGSAFCIFFGPTPVSRGGGPRAYSPVNVFGSITGDTAPLRGVPQGARVLVTAAG